MHFIVSVFSMHLIAANLYKYYVLCGRLAKLLT